MDAACAGEDAALSSYRIAGEADYPPSRARGGRNFGGRRGMHAARLCIHFSGQVSRRKKIFRNLGDVCGGRVAHKNHYCVAVSRKKSGTRSDPPKYYSGNSTVARSVI